MGLTPISYEWLGRFADATAALEIYLEQVPDGPRSQEVRERLVALAGRISRAAPAG